MKAKRILIVDDDRNIQSMVRLCLIGDGYAVETAANGSEALDMIAHSTPDLMLLDLAMPVMDGMSLLTRLSAWPRERTPRVVVMTAHGSVRTAIAAVRLGASDFLEKPFAPDDIRLSVASVLEEVPAAKPVGHYDSVLQSVREALRSGSLPSAEALLIRAGSIADDDAAFLNLAGVLHEAHGRIESARRFYVRAAERDPAYFPAQENLRRLTELQRFEKTERAVLLGDEAVPVARD